ncbi:hypothetical protein C2E20_0195 [Micractinium conductrix]|uniref:Uncharacterized protein n=1 Tax=Micractinium conductrix TaxID=554055 RepID=A0A2P6VRG6_9CHLO|nr:hypothetical protein C2E20_0195 [Micractinium conductrix]|eukprot:PSC76657.1 hypothetical protein C2E20_0195 [Micractinium conductrix]
MAAEKETDFDPSLDSVALNAARVMNHVLQKGYQMGGVVGTLLVAPATLLRLSRAGRLPRGGALTAAAGAVGKTVLVTTALAGALGAARLASLEDVKAGVEDRVYRLHYNQGQNRADRFALAGSAVGVAAAALLVPMSPTALLGGGAAGAAAALLAHVGTAKDKDE